MRWRAVADPETARRCWGVIQEIERCLGEHLPAETNPSLSGGKAGLAVFFAYLDAARQGSEASDLVFDALGQSIEALSQSTLQPALYGGFSGIGWAVEHLTRRFYEEDPDLNAAIDDGLRELLSAPDQRLPYELINGLAGWGVYLLERLPHPAAAETLGLVLDHLERTAEESEAGIAWHTAPEWLPPWQREAFPEGWYNLGVSHGVPGVVGFLAAARRAGIDDPRVDRLAEGAVRWVLGGKLPAEDARFPAIHRPDRPEEPSRSAWCYGDPGIAAVLLSAGRAFGRPDWEEEALSLMRLAARRPLKAVAVDDACLCHGAVGLAHLFNRFHQATGDPGMKEAAQAWYRRALDLQLPGEGFAGFRTFVAMGPDDPGSWVADPGLLVGAAGVGLGLLAAVSEVEPAWDRMLLTAIPPDGGPR